MPVHPGQGRTADVGTLARQLASRSLSHVLSSEVLPIHYESVRLASACCSDASVVVPLDSRLYDIYFSVV